MRGAHYSPRDAEEPTCKRDIPPAASLLRPGTICALVASVMTVIRLAHTLNALSFVLGCSLGAAAQEVAQTPAPPPAPAFRELARQQIPTVVSISARTSVHSWNETETDALRLFGLKPPPASGRIERTVASGFIISAAGDILTNYHAIAGAETLEVGLFGDEKNRYRAFRVGVDPATDTALIRLEHPPQHLQSATLGDSSTLAAGDWVMAIGNPFELTHTVTVGVVSSGSRPFEIQEGQWQDLIQLDAAINLGHSGGPLFNLQGEVVGITVGTLDVEAGGNVGIGFAMPIGSIKALLAQLRKGDIHRSQLAGVEFHESPILADEARELGLAEPRGALVRSVDRESASGRAGVRAGDVIVAFDRHPVADARDFVADISLTRPGTCVTLDMVREGTHIGAQITLDAWPIERPANRSTSANHAGGLTFEDLEPAMATTLGAPAGLGAVIVQVAPGSPADDAMLIADDVILRINQRPIHDAAEANRELERLDVSRPVFFLVWRDGAEFFLELRRN